jgi:hypothetical protein
MSSSCRRFAVLGLTLSLVVACGSPAPPPVDAAMPEPDASDGTCATFTAAGFPPLPSACLPRCSQGSHTAWDTCADLPCFFAAAAVTSDATPAAHVRTPNGSILDVTCQRTGAPNDMSCVDWQLDSCAYEACPNEFDRTWQCTSSCDDERSALNACVAASATYESCWPLRAGLCFPYP